MREPPNRGGGQGARVVDLASIRRRISTTSSARRQASQHHLAQRLDLLEQYRHAVIAWDSAGAPCAMPRPTDFGLQLAAPRPSEFAWGPT